MSRLHANYFIGQTLQGCVYFFAEAVEGVFLWGAHPCWEKSESATLKEAAKTLNIKKVERLTPADVPLFLLLPLDLGEHPESCISRDPF